jgi:hypothetical protein
MHPPRILRAPLCVLCGLFAILLAAPSAALANHVNAVASSASCALVDDVPTVTLNVVFESFGDANKPVSGTIALDGAVVKTYSDVTWAGADFTLVYTQATTAGAHTLRGDFTWPGKTEQDNGSVEKSVECPAPPTVTPPPLTPPGSTPPTIQPPGGGLLPGTVVSGLARLRGPSGCVRGTFTARVKGRSVASVSFFVDGKLVKRMTRARDTYTLKVRAGKFGFGRHRVVARVTFLAESQTAPRRLRLTFRRCASGSVSPRFTG